VDHALAWLPPAVVRDRRSLHAADVGTGSGCIAISLAASLQQANLLSTLCATDLSEAALKIARHNALKHHLGRRISWLQSDLLSAYRSHSLDLICANLPYIPSELLPSLPVARYEPWLALDGGTGGLIQIHRLLDQASLLETRRALIAKSRFHREAVLSCITRFPGAGLRCSRIWQDATACFPCKKPAKPGSIFSAWYKFMSLF
jgi:release factor glutamine methyltransferase